MKESIKNLQNEEIIRIILQGESELVEFKTSFKWDVNEQKCNKKLPQMVTEAMCAFANSRGGGVLFIGVTDNGKLEGISSDITNCFHKSIDKFQIEVPKKVREDIGAGIIYTIEVKVLESKNICIIDVEPSISPIFMLKGNFLVRKGSSNHKLNAKETYEYIGNYFSEYSEEEEYESQIKREYKVDTKLINFYCKAIINDQISEKNLENTLTTLYIKSNQIHNIAQLDEEICNSIDNILILCSKLLNHEKKQIRKRILEILYGLVRKVEIRKLVYDQCYDDLVAMYQKGVIENELIYILNAFGYFKNIKSTILEAIKIKNIRLLTLLTRFFNFKSLVSERFDLILTLNSMIDSFNDAEDNQIISVIKSMKEKFENLDS